MKHESFFGRMGGGMLAVLLSVLAFAFTANATDLPTTPSINAITTNGTHVTITTARMASFECAGGQVTTTRVDSDTKYYQDANGALCAKLKKLPNFQTAWVQQPGAQRWWQITWDNMQCYGGSTMVNYVAGISIPNDGCQLDTVVKGMSQ